MFNTAKNYTPLPKTETDEGNDLKYFFIPFIIIIFFGGLLVGGYWYYRNKALQSVTVEKKMEAATPTPEDSIEVVEEVEPSTAIPKPSSIMSSDSQTPDIGSPEDINLGTDDASLNDLQKELQNLQ